MSVLSTSHRSDSSFSVPRVVVGGFLVGSVIGIITILATKAISHLRASTSPVPREATSSNDTASSNGETPLSAEQEAALQNWIDQVVKNSPEYNARVAASEKIQKCFVGETTLDLSRTRIKSFEGIEGVLAGLAPSCVISLPRSLNNQSLENLCDKVKEVAGPALKMAF